MTLFWLNETARFLLAEARYTECFEVIEEMGKLNVDPNFTIQRK
jgi:hypothetical protein